MATTAARIVRETLTAVGSPTLLLPTGSTPAGLYQELVKSPSPVDWGNARIFALDEYVGIESNDPRSFRFQLWHDFCAPLGLKPSQLITPDGMAENPEAEAYRYESAISSSLPLSLAVLGVGTNGHVAFNEPGVSPTETTHVATLAPATREDNQYIFTDGPVPQNAITVGISTIMTSTALLLIALGKKKAPAIEALLTGHPTSEKPVTWLASHPGLTVVVDEGCHNALSSSQACGRQRLIPESQRGLGG